METQPTLKADLACSTLEQTQPLASQLSLKSKIIAQLLPWYPPRGRRRVYLRRRDRYPMAKRTRSKVANGWVDAAAPGVRNEGSTNLSWSRRSPVQSVALRHT